MLALLNVKKTKLTEPAVKKLAAALPKCRIESDFGLFEPADRRAAAYVFSVGGAIRIDDQKVDIREAGDLPRAQFRLTHVDLKENRKVNDAGLARFKGSTNLVHLDLWGTNVTDTGLANFNGSKNLTNLNLDSTQMSDAALANFKDCKNLKNLGLGVTKVSNAALADFARNWPNLVGLGLNVTGVNDTVLAHLKACKNLTELYLEKTLVTEAGIADLRKALPACTVVSNFGVLGP